MLSKTLIGNGFGCWKTIVTRRRSAVGSIAVMSSPSSVIRPLSEAVLVSSVSRLSERSSVVLPQPDGPISASTSPWRTGSETRVDGELLAVGDRELLDLHPRDRDLRRADPPVLANCEAGRRSRGRCGRCRWSTAPAPPAPATGSSSSSRRTGGGRQLVHVPSLLARRWITSTAKLSASTITSRTNAAAYAFSGWLRSPLGRVRVDEAGQGAPGALERAQQRDVAARVEVRRRAEQHQDDRRVADDPAEAEHRPGRHRGRLAGQQDPARRRGLRLADRVGGLAHVLGDRLQPLARAGDDQRQGDQREHRRRGEERAAEDDRPRWSRG